MKITGFQALTLAIPEDDPLANMPEEVGRKRPVVALKLRTDIDQSDKTLMAAEQCCWEAIRA